jgi:DNA-binding transcriptional LysR family regulator
MIDLQNLHAFITVSESGSFSRAAEKLFITQSAVSKRVATLEQTLETRLFDRIGHNISLTEAGRVLLPRAHKILLEVEDSRRSVTNLTGTVSGELHIGTSHHIGLHRLPPVLRDYTEQFPEVSLDIQFIESETICNRVEHGDLELGIVTLPPYSYRDLKQMAIWHDPLAIVVSPTHTLAQKLQPQIQDLSNHHAILPAAGTFTRELLEQVLTPREVNLKPGLSSNYLETIKMLVSVGLGWSVLPHTMIDQELKILDYEDVIMERTLGIVCHTSRTLSNAAQALVQTLEKYRSIQLTPSGATE